MNSNRSRAQPHQTVHKNVYRRAAYRAARTHCAIDAKQHAITHDDSNRENASKVVPAMH